MLRYLVPACIALAAAALFFAGRTTGATAARPCALDMPLRPADCARLVDARGRDTETSARPATGSAILLYAAEPFQSQVAEFAIGPKGLSPAGAIPLGTGAAPTALAVDRAQHLYVAVSSFSATGPQEVRVFARGASHPARTYRAGLTGPVGVALSPGNTLYVANLATPGAPQCTASQGNGNVVEYAAGSLKPTAVVTGIPGCPRGVALDANSNLYVSYSLLLPGSEDSDVLEYSPGSTTGTPLHLHVPSGANLYSLAFDARGNLVVANSTEDDSLNQILIYPPGSRTPSRTIQYGGYWGPEWFALWNDRIFAPAYIAEPLSMAAGEFAYPSGRQLAAQNPPGLYYYGFAVGSP